MTMIVCVQHRPGAYIIASDSLYSYDDRSFHAGRKWRLVEDNIVCMAGETPYPDTTDFSELHEYCTDNECTLILTGKEGLFVFSPEEVYKVRDDICVLGSGGTLALGAVNMKIGKIKKSSPEKALSIVQECMLSACKYAVNCDGPIHVEYFIP